MPEKTTTWQLIKGRHVLRTLILAPTDREPFYIGSEHVGYGHAAESVMEHESHVVLDGDVEVHGI